MHHDDPFNRRACCFDITGEWFLRLDCPAKRCNIPRSAVCRSREATIAPKSSAYRADALLLSYGGFRKNGRAPQCCPGYLLAPNEAGLLTPSRAISEKWLLRLAAGRAGGVSPPVLKRSGCGGRIRTGDTRRMKPLPYHLATPLLKRKIGTASRCCPGSAGFWRPRCAS